MLVTVTGPSAAEGLPWDPGRCEIRGPHKHGGGRGCRVVRDLAEEWNESASERYARMWKGASVEADRWLRRLCYRGHLPRRVMAKDSLAKASVHEPVGKPATVAVSLWL